MNTNLQVMVVGGYGEFGGRLCRLLLRDKHIVTVAGRSLQKSRRFCEEYGGKPLKFNSHTDLETLASLNVDVVIDAAGPFQSYGEECYERYKLAIAALNCNAHYLDLSDDGFFSKDIIVLDSLAKQKNKFALSGVSSTPALSGAAVSAMKSKFTRIDKIETTILPGNRAPKGYSVMWAILHQVGNSVSFWRSNAWTDCKGWSEPVKKEIYIGSGIPIKRDACLIHTADAILFPEYFKASTVLFRAGLALPTMHKSLQLLGVLRQYKLLPNLTKFIKALQWLAEIMTPFGSDHGGMLVEVTGINQQQTDIKLIKLQKRIWVLQAEPSEGPFIPGIAVRAILRHISKIPAGARPCIDELPLKEFEHAMEDISVKSDMKAEDFEYLFQSTLQNSWLLLPPELQKTHEVIDKKVLSGTAKITRGQSLITKLIAAIFRFPKATNQIEVEVTKTRIGEKEVWERNFGGQRFKSTLSPLTEPSLINTNKVTSETSRENKSIYKTALIEERFGLMSFVLSLPVEDQTMNMHVVSGRFLGIPIPAVLLPISNTQEYVSNKCMHFSVELIAPLRLGLIVKYEGSLT